MEKNKVLFIDDELNILASLRRSLMDEEYSCMFFDNGPEALEAMEKHEISVVVTDMKMPKMNGLELLKECKQKYPDTVRIVMSGYTHLPQVLAAINQGDIFKFIPKPWNLDDEFIPAIKEGIEYYNLKKNHEQLTLELAKKNELYKHILKSTQNRFTIFQKEIDKIKVMSSYIFDSMIHQLTCSDESLYLLNLYKDLYTRYLNSLPSDNIEFGISKIIDDLKASLNYEGSIDKISFNISPPANEMCYGNYSLFSSILYNSCKCFIKLGLNSITLAQLSLTNKEGWGKVEFVIIGQMKKSSGGIDPLIIEKGIDILHSFLIEVSKHMNGQVILNKVDRNIGLKFTGTFVDNRKEQNG